MCMCYYRHVYTTHVRDTEVQAARSAEREAARRRWSDAMAGAAEWKALLLM